MDIPKRLIMFDWDGVVVKPDPNSFSILREAMLNILEKHKVTTSEVYEKLNWPSIFEKCKGTTERYYMDLILQACNVPIPEQNALFQHFIGERSRLIQQFNRRRGLKAFDDTNVFEDFLGLKQKLQEDQTHENIYAIVTGNPQFVIKDRVPEELNKLFHFWVGGDLGKTRADLVHIALQEARERYGFRGLIDNNGFLVNAFYVDDAERAIISVVKREKVRSVWIPREVTPAMKALVPKDYRDKLSLADVGSFRNVILLEKFEKEFGPTLANRYLVGDNKDRTTQVVFTAETLYDHFLLIPEGRGAVFNGWLDPEAHMWGRIKYSDTKERYFPEGNSRGSERR